MAEPRIVQRDDPEDVFTLLSDDIRVDILQALWAADGPVPFSELNQSVGVRDSGQFNYHLDKLVDRFVRKTPDGYELTQAGKNINGAIEAGAYTLEASIEPIELERACPYCTGHRTLTYEDEVVGIDCDSCGLSYQFAVPPGVFAGYETGEIPDVANRYLSTTFRKVQAGFCWFCEGQTKPTLVTREPPTVAEPAASNEAEDATESQAEPSAVADSHPTGEEVPVVRYECQRCGHVSTCGLLVQTRDHPAVQSFYHEQGTDIRAGHVWDFPELDPAHLEVRSRAPLRAAVTYNLNGETLTLVVDEEGAVVGVED